jgi:hypothetical protein
MYRNQEQEDHFLTEDVEIPSTSEDSEPEQRTEPSQAGRLFRGSLVVAALLGVVCLATVHSSDNMASTSTKTFQKKSDNNDLVSAAASSSTDTAAGFASFFGPSPAPPGSTAVSQSSQVAPAPASAVASTVVSAPASAVASTAVSQSSQVVPSETSSANRPEEDLNDGNKCADDEESLGELCYQKCSILTNGAAPVRISAFGCAKSNSFGDVIGEKIASLVPCQGYDVAGNAEGNGCPHSHGGCLNDEELSLGKCYKKCSALTNGQYPHRTTMSTCCKTTNFIECLNPANFKIDFKYAVGGGNDEHKAIHDPIKSVTEAKP